MATGADLAHPPQQTMGASKSLPARQPVDLVALARAVLCKMAVARTGSVLDQTLGYNVFALQFDPSFHEAAGLRVYRLDAAKLSELSDGLLIFRKAWRDVDTGRKPPAGMLMCTSDHQQLHAAIMLALKEGDALPKPYLVTDAVQDKHTVTLFVLPDASHAALPPVFATQRMSSVLFKRIAALGDVPKLDL
jgi:hypothetical protein